MCPTLTPVLLPPDKVLCDADEPLSHVYFIETGLVSLVSVFEDGTTAEMATVGREGLVGIDTLLSSERAPGRYVAPVSGLALAIEAAGSRTHCRRARSCARSLKTTLRHSFGKRSRPQPVTAPTWLRSGVRAGC